MNLISLPESRDRAQALCAEQLQKLHCRTDRWFAWLLGFEWLAGIAVALWVSQKAWSGLDTEVHLHVWAALFLGGAIAGLPIFLAIIRPGQILTRQVIAVGQVLFSALFIHLTGGRIETHFHVFVSLAFLAAYRDWRVLFSASVVVAADHLLRGLFWPQSVYGVLSASYWRWLEHAAWVVFEDVILIQFAVQGRREMLAAAQREAILETLSENMEQQVLARTAELHSSRHRLQENEAYLFAVVEHSPVAIVTLDRDNRVQMCNSAFERLFLYRGPEIVGKALDDLIVPPDLAPEARALTTSTLEGQRVEFGSQRCRKDGTLVDVEIFGGPMAVEGHLIGTCALYTDISARKRSEEARQESEARYRDLFENATDIIFTIDRAGNFTAVNRAAERVTGYSREEAVHMNITQIVPAQFGSLLVQAKRHLLSGRPADPIEVTIQTKEGGFMDVEVHSRLVHQQGKDVEIQGIARDITERNKAEEALRGAKNAAEAATKAKSDFLANMSHEIRTPMNGIMGMTELVLDTQLTSEQREYLGIVKSSADSLLSIINDILDFSKIEAGKMDLAQTDFDVHEIVTEAARLLGLRADQKGVELVCDIQAGLPRLVVGDPGRLRQVLINLLGNAVKFTERGDVVVRVEEATRSEHEIAIHFSVRDTGIGIPLEKQRSIFEAFTQADNSKTRHFGGTGLGLTISSRLVEMMRGNIWVESEPGKGSTFHFTARLGLAKPGSEVDPRTPADLSGIRVLVVDDNATNRQILKAMLSNWQMLPELVADGSEAIAAIERAAQAGRPYRLVLLDACMPVMDGFELAANIQRSRELHRLTIMMLTSTGHRGDSARCRELGIAGYLVKPVRQTELLESILKVLRPAPPNSFAAVAGTRANRTNRRRRHSILLAEDNPVNAKLAVRLLEKEGLSVRVVGNGREAVAALDQEPFDLILMDVQMPEVDGLEATRRIREREAGSESHIPIVAMTAHALTEDRQRCLDAGMDGYISKPVQVQVLKETLSQHLAAAERKSPESEQSNPRAGVMTKDDLLAQLDNDSELLVELIELFREKAPKALYEIRRAVECRDRDALAFAAHAFKGSVANFGITAAYHLAAQLEQMAQHNEMSGTILAFQDLECEAVLIDQALRNVQEEVAYANSNR